jgi:hypothetical protein
MLPAFHASPAPVDLRAVTGKAGTITSLSPVKEPEKAVV